MSKFLGKLQFAQSRQSMKWENYSSNKPVRCVYSPRARDAIAAARCRRRRIRRLRIHEAFCFFAAFDRRRRRLMMGLKRRLSSSKAEEG